MEVKIKDERLDRATIKTIFKPLEGYGGDLFDKVRLWIGIKVRDRYNWEVSREIPETSGGICHFDFYAS